MIGQTFSTRADAFIGGLMFGEHLILETHRISLCLHYDVHRSIDKDMAWILPLLADTSTMIKAQIFVLRKDTADILGRKI